MNKEYGSWSEQLSDDGVVVSHICRYIQSHLDEKLAYEYLQKRFFVSRHFLAVTFPRYVGKTVTAYIIERRLEFASALIQQGVGLEEAAGQAGFETSRHFFRQFKNHYGSTPGTLFKKEPEICVENP